MEDLEKKLKQLKDRTEQASQAHLRAEMRAEAALGDRAKALQALQDEFNLTSVEDAEALMKSLYLELDEKIKGAEKKLGDVV